MYKTTATVTCTAYSSRQQSCLHVSLSWSCVFSLDYASVWIFSKLYRTCRRAGERRVHTAVTVDTEAIAHVAASNVHYVALKDFVQPHALAFVRLPIRVSGKRAVLMKLVKKCLLALRTVSVKKVTCAQKTQLAFRKERTGAATFIPVSTTIETADPEDMP